MTDFMTVQPVRTFAVGKELKTKRSDPFPVESGEAKLLAAQGLVTVVGPGEAPEDEAPAEAPAIMSERPKRKGKSDAVDEDA